MESWWVVGSSVTPPYPVWKGQPGTPQALVWRCLGKGSSVTQAVEAEVVVRGWLDQGLQAAVGLTLGRRAGGMGEVALGGARQEALPLLT